MKVCSQKPKNTLDTRGAKKTEQVKTGWLELLEGKPQLKINKISQTMCSQLELDLSRLDDNQFGGNFCLKGDFTIKNENLSYDSTSKNKKNCPNRFFKIRSSIKIHE